MAGLSADPVKRQRQLAGLAKGREKQGHRPPPPPEKGNQRAARHRQNSDIESFEVDAPTLEALRSAIGDPDMSANPGVAIGAEVIGGLAARVLYGQQAAQRFASRTGRPMPGQKMLARNERVLLQYLSAYGLTPASRARMGLQVTQMQAAASPVRTVERAEAMGRMLQSLGAVPHPRPQPEPELPDAEVIPDDDQPLDVTLALHRAEVVPLHREEA